MHNLFKSILFHQWNLKFKEYKLPILCQKEKRISSDNTGAYTFITKSVKCAVHCNSNRKQCSILQWTTFIRKTYYFKCVKTGTHIIHTRISKTQPAVTFMTTQLINIYTVKKKIMQTNEHCISKAKCSFLSYKKTTTTKQWMFIFLITSKNK
jgi:hypothetical protein